MVSEEKVRNTVTEWLSQNNYELRLVATTRGRPSISRRRGRPRKVKPPDLIAKRRNQNYYYFVEAKGDEATTTRFFEVIGEILVQMARTTPAAYAIALPMSYKPIILELLSLRAWQKAGFRIIIVRKNNVVELKPTEADFDKLGKLR